ncbi:hypothetical protein [Streptomyces xanthii]|uniref:Uncharacterized protein n=1 Tax=Streptomyces xanthii TaxID=2768069 RepID=A0A7H1B2A4_9ACTN|nr:hypothetical protein [Streptomyces xanthii]QNS02859.1 hypothetical protein IAG42_03950 [Streptomyces xanthii]
MTKERARAPRDDGDDRGDARKDTAPADGGAEEGLKEFLLARKDDGEAADALTPNEKAQKSARKD